MKRGGDIDGPAIVGSLLEAYRLGAFPMADPRTGSIDFYAADPRGLLPLKESGGDGEPVLRVPDRLERTIRQRRFELSCDSAFADVVRGCRDVRPKRERWINETIVSWYSILHEAGHAHSVEAWRNDPASGDRVLVGGIYGVAIGAAFFGESMFIRARPRLADGTRDPRDGTDASKVCLVTLVRHLRACGFTLFDTQMVTEHVGRMGGYEVKSAKYRQLLDAAVAQPGKWRPFQP